MSVGALIFWGLMILACLAICADSKRREEAQAPLRPTVVQDPGRAIVRIRPNPDLMEWRLPQPAASAGTHSGADYGPPPLAPGEIMARLIEAAIKDGTLTVGEPFYWESQTDEYGRVIPTRIVPATEVADAVGAEVEDYLTRREPGR
jgi:hypothetical protein